MLCVPRRQKSLLGCHYCFVCIALNPWPWESKAAEFATRVVRCCSGLQTSSCMCDVCVCVWRIASPKSSALWKFKEKKTSPVADFGVLDFRTEQKWDDIPKEKLRRDVVVGPRSLWQSRRRGSWASNWRRFQRSKDFLKIFLGSQLIVIVVTPRISWTNLASGGILWTLPPESWMFLQRQFPAAHRERLQPPKSNQQSLNRWNNWPQILLVKLSKLTSTGARFPAESLPSQLFFEVTLMLWNLALLLWRQLQDTWNP